MARCVQARGKLCHSVRNPRALRWRSLAARRILGSGTREENESEQIPRRPWRCTRGQHQPGLQDGADSRHDDTPAYRDPRRGSSPRAAPKVAAAAAGGFGRGRERAFCPRPAAALYADSCGRSLRACFLRAPLESEAILDARGPKGPGWARSRVPGHCCGAPMEKAFTGYSVDSEHAILVVRLWLDGDFVEIRDCFVGLIKCIAKGELMKPATSRDMNFHSDTRGAPTLRGTDKIWE